jgi:heptosyltransferase-2
MPCPRLPRPVTVDPMPTPLLVRLPNHLGDACMCMPALDLLAQRDYAITLAGKRWVASLFAGYDWPVVPLAGWREGLRALHDARRRQPQLQALLFTNSFGSALQCRLAGMPVSGYPTDGRRLLLRHAVPVPAAWHGDMHTVAYYHALAAHFAGTPPDLGPPMRLNLRIPAHAAVDARQMLGLAGISDPYVVLCPAAIGRHHGQIKAWPEFGRLSADLRRRGITVVAFPGPGETAAVHAAVPATIVLPECDVAVFAATLAGSRLVVANDSGAGHVAAAVNAPLVSVFGVTEPSKTRPWGPSARLVGSERGWPNYEEVLATSLATLETGR